MEKLVKKLIEELESRLAKALPDDPNEDGTFKTDGSHEELLGVFERAFDRASAVAYDAIKMLKSTLDTKPEP